MIKPLNKTIAILLLSLFSCLSLQAQNPAKAPDPESPDFVTAKLLIASDGEALYQILGHAVLLMECPSAGLRYVFSFESEALNGDYGRLFHRVYGRVVPVPPEEYLQQYKDEGRSVTAYTLNLTPHEKRELWRVLDQYVANGGEKFNIRTRSCSTILLRAINDAVAPDSIDVADNSIVKQDVGFLVDNLSSDDYVWNEQVLLIALGSEADKSQVVSRSMPGLIENGWKDYRIVAPDGSSRPLFKGKPEQIIHAAEREPSRIISPIMVASAILTICIVISLLQIFGKARRESLIFDIIIAAIITIVGTILLFLECIPARIGNLCNPCFVLLSPIPLIVWLILRKRSYFRKIAIAWAWLLILFAAAGPFISLSITPALAIFALVPAIRILTRYFAPSRS